VVQQQTEEAIRSLSVASLRQQLDARAISHRHALEKEDFIRLLLEASGISSTKGHAAAAMDARSAAENNEFVRLRRLEALGLASAKRPTSGTTAGTAASAVEGEGVTSDAPVSDSSWADALRTLSVADLREQLQSKGVNSANVIEKEELVRMLVVSMT